jgi:hypothetical protein
MKTQYGIIVFAIVAAAAILAFDRQIQSTGNEIVSRQTEDHQRTRFFPREEVFPQSLPSQNNLWVFLLAGQSNMAGRGMVEPQDTLPSERILTVNRNGKIVLAKEPLHFYDPTRTGLDCGVSFARTLIASIPDSVSILLLPSAIGGSSISQWLGDSSYRGVRLLTNASQLLQIGKRYGAIKGILWHQGETDALTLERIRAYNTRLKTLADTFRTIAGNDRLPLLIGELGSFSADHDRWEEINIRIRSVAAGDSRMHVVPTGDLNHKGDSVHFDSNSLRLMGKRFAEKYLHLEQRIQNE